MRKDSGKALTIFLILIAVILISLTAISVFLLIKQVQLRESAESHLAQLKTSESALRSEFEQVKKEKELLEQKSKEAEAKIENLLEEIDLVEGVRDEVRNENRELKDALEQLEIKNKEMSGQIEAQEKEVEAQVSGLQEQLDAAVERNKNLEEKRKKLEEEYNTLKMQLSDYEGSAAGAGSETVDSQADKQVNVDLKEIVVSSQEDGQGQIVSVDHEAEFVIVNMGERHGISIDSLLGVYDGETYLGDIIITKVLPEMSAADFVSPLTSRDVSEGILVKVKP